MARVKIFTKANCPKCPAVKEIGARLKEEGVRVLDYDVDTLDGLAEASFYSVLSTPSIIVEDEQEREIVGWRGVIPSLQELRESLVRSGP